LRGVPSNPPGRRGRRGSTSGTTRVRPLSWHRHSNSRPLSTILELPPKYQPSLKCVWAK
jgi:hypothetical protein